MWTRLKALPPYFGGKRRLLGRIFKQMPKPEEAPVLVDAFLGGGSVSLFGKARGYRVIANDIAYRSSIVGKALIENDHVTLMPVGAETTRWLLRNSVSQSVRSRCGAGR